MYENPSFWSICVFIIMTTNYTFLLLRLKLDLSVGIALIICIVIMTMERPHRDCKAVCLCVFYCLNFN